MKTTILKSKKTNKYYKIIKDHISWDDYASYAKYYLYNPRTKRAYGNWKGLGWFTRNSHAIKSLRNRLKNNLILI